MKPGYCPGSGKVQTWRLKEVPPGQIHCPDCTASWRTEDTAGMTVAAIIPDHAPGEP